MAKLEEQVEREMKRYKGIKREKKRIDPGCYEIVYVCMCAVFA